MRPLNLAGFRESYIRTAQGGRIEQSFVCHLFVYRIYKANLVRTWVVKENVAVVRNDYTQ
jgi:hypothetical protein